MCSDALITVSLALVPRYVPCALKVILLILREFAYHVFPTVEDVLVKLMEFVCPVVKGSL